MDAVGDADAAIEADEIGAAAEEHMLAVVDDLVDAGMQIRTGTAAQVAAALEQLHAQARLGQSASRAHAGHASADDSNGFHWTLPQTIQRNGLSW